LLILHIGTHKTGTSALQAFLKSNADGLQAKGVRYLKAGREDRIAHHPLAWALRGRYHTEMDVWDGAREELAEAKEPFVVMSSEGFWYESPEDVKKQLAYDGPIKIVAYLRRQDSFLPSLYKQAVSGGRKTDFDTWLTDMSHRGDYLPVLDRWADAFSAEAITVRPYERDGHTIDVVEDFLSVLGIDPQSMPENRRRGSHNPSPRRELLQFLRAFNQLNLKINYEKFFFTVIKRNKAYIRSADLLTYDQRRALLSRYEDGNRALAERYWREQAPLFPDIQQSELPDIWTPDDPEYFQLTVDMLDAVVQFISGEVELKKKKKPNAKAP